MTVEATKIMTTTHLLYALAGTVLLALIVASVRIRFWINEGKKLLQPGYMTPKVSWWARATRLFIGRIAMHLRVGRLIIIGKENLRYRGRLLMLPNHQIEKDAVIVTAVFGTMHFRFLMAINQITKLRAPFAAWLGGIAVHHDRNPAASVRTAMRALGAEQNSSLVVFPQGRLIRNNALLREDFFAGALMIGKHAAKKSELPFAVLPVGIYYDRDSKHATLLFRAARLFGITWFSDWFNETTFGATVAFGKPIPIADLPDDLEKATDIVFNEIKALSELAEKETKRRLG